MDRGVSLHLRYSAMESKFDINFYNELYRFRGCLGVVGSGHMCLVQGSIVSPIFNTIALNKVALYRPTFRSVIRQSDQLPH